MVVAAGGIDMILKVANYKEGIPEQLETAYDPKELDLEFVDLHYVQKVELKGTAERIRQTVTFHGVLDSCVEQVCARCLDKIQNKVVAPFDLSYDIHGRETVDATDDLRDILILGHPERFLCRVECRGICGGCGANLNRETCRCQKSVPVKAAPFEQLKLKFKKEDC